MAQEHDGLRPVLDGAFSVLDRALKGHHASLRVREVGTVKYLGGGIARVDGLPTVGAEETVLFERNVPGLVFNLDPDEVGVILLGDSRRLHAGSEVHRTGQVMDVPVGEALIGRVVDPNGRPLDGRGPVRTSQRFLLEREAAPIMRRAPVTVPLQTGIKVIDALIPVGQGQRELIVGDRRTGKSAIALDAVINQRDKGVLCVYCALGQRTAATAKLVADLRQHGAMDYSIVVVATGDAPPGLRYVAPYAGTSIAEYFMEQGRDVLIVYDDLTRHARAYRELSLLLRRPPGREAFPGDIFYIHSRLLERSTHLRKEHGGGSLTALPIVETEAQNIAAYIPTNLISITDGQIYLSPDLFQKGILPAVDVGRSVSRVGGKAQLPAYRAVAGDLRLAYSQFEELEQFSRFGTRLDQQTRNTLEHGRRVREVLKQSQFEPMDAAEQVAVLLAVSAGLFDDVPLDRVARAERAVRKTVAERLPDLHSRIRAGQRLSDDDRETLLQVARSAVASEPGAA